MNSKMNSSLICSKSDKKNKVYMLIYLQDGNKMSGVFSSLKKAERYLFKQVNNYMKEVCYDSIEEILKMKKQIIEDYEIRIVYGIDKKRPIYLNIFRSYSIFDNTNIITNDLEKWEKWTNESSKNMDMNDFIIKLNSPYW